MELSVSGTPLRARGAAGVLALARAADAGIMPGLAGVLAYGATAQGAFYRPQAALFTSALAALALASLRSARDLAPAIWAFALLGSSLIVAGFASGWGPNAPLIAAGLAAATAIIPVAQHVIARGERMRLIDTMAWVGAVVSVTGIVGVALHHAPWGVRAQGLWRGASTLTYANAMGCLCLLAIGASALALVDRSTPARRIAAFLTLTGLATTLSRGAVVSIVVALVVLAALGKVSLVRALARPGAGALVAFASLLPSIAGPARPVIAIAGLVAGAVVSLGVGPQRARSAALPWVAVVLVVPLLASVGTIVGSRALPSSETRLSTWRNTLEVAKRHPILGTGPGTFWILEESRAGDVGVTRYAHNEYLQILFETGALGLAAVVAAGGVLARWVWRRRRIHDGVFAMAAAMCAAFAAHGALDFVWRMPLLVTLAFCWLALAVTPTLEDGGRS